MNNNNCTSTTQSENTENNDYKENKKKKHITKDDKQPQNQDTYTLAIGTYLGNLKLYNLIPNELRIELKEELSCYSSSVTCVHFIKDRYIVSGSKDELIKVINLDNGSIKSAFAGKRVISYNGDVQTFEQRDLHVLDYTSFEFNRRNESNNIKYVKKNNLYEALYAVLYTSGDLLLWNIEKKNPIAMVVKNNSSICNLTNHIMDICWSSNGNTLFALSRGSITIYNLMHDKVHTLNNTTGSNYNSFYFGNNYLITTTINGSLVIYKFENHNLSIAHTYINEKKDHKINYKTISILFENNDDIVLSFLALKNSNGLDYFVYGKDKLVKYELLHNNSATEIFTCFDIKKTNLN